MKKLLKHSQQQQSKQHITESSNDNDTTIWNNTPIRHSNQQLKQQSFLNTHK